MEANGGAATVLAARALTAGLAALPPTAARGLGGGLGAAAARLPGARRAEAERRISAAFPGRGRAWTRRTAIACYRHFGREAAELARLARRGAGGLPERVRGRDEGLAALRGGLAGGRGILIVTGHLGNWEAAGALLAASGLRLAAVVRRQSNRRFDAFLEAARRRMGVEPVPMGEARRRIPALLAEGRPVALAADQDARRRGVFVPFLGRPASTFRGPATLALASGAPLFFGVLVREGDGYRLRVEEVPSPPRGPEAVRVLTARWVRCLERQVRERPEQYFWMHRRWKTRPSAAESSGPRLSDERKDAE